MFNGLSLTRVRMGLPSPGSSLLTYTHPQTHTDTHTHTHTHAHTQKLMVCEFAYWIKARATKVNALI